MQPMEIPKKSSPKVVATGKAKDPTSSATTAGSPAAPVKVAPMFRGSDWLTFGLTFLIVWVIYLDPGARAHVGRFWRVVHRFVLCRHPPPSGLPFLGDLQLVLDVDFADWQRGLAR